jgi:hypothetical protein
MSGQKEYVNAVTMASVLSVMHISVHIVPLEMLLSF